MSAVEIVLIIVGIVFMIGSFMVTEKLSGAELNKIAELSQDEIKRILEKELNKSTARIEEQIDTSIDDSIDKVERALDKETNEKIMAISEFSDTVVENMNKTHNEIMFLYSMLNDKHTSLTELSGELSKLAAEINDRMEQAKAEPQQEEPMEIVAEPSEETLEISEEEVVNHNERILEMYRLGKSYIEIARELGLGLGEVKLVIELFKGEK